MHSAECTLLNACVSVLMTSVLSTNVLPRERVWREVAQDVQWEAANPGRASKRRGEAAVDTTDQAYLRAYIDVDSKRLKR